MSESYKNCIVCGKSFRYTHKSRNFCSETCYHEHNKKAGRIKELEKELKQKDAEIERLKAMARCIEDGEMMEYLSEIECEFSVQHLQDDEYAQSLICEISDNRHKIKQIEAELVKKDQEYNHMQHVLSLRNGWAEVERLEAVVQELAENAAEYYMVSVKDAIKLATERVKAKQSG